MARKISSPPPESVRDWLISREGWLWWNPEKATSKKHKIESPIRFECENTKPTVVIEGRTYSVSRLNWWFNTGEWPECVIHKDHDKTNNHFDNLMPATSQQSNFHRQFDVRTYSIHERVTKTGKRYYYAYIKMFGESKVLGKFHTEQEAVNSAIQIRKILHGDYLAEDLKQILSH